MHCQWMQGIRHHPLDHLGNDVSCALRVYIPAPSRGSPMEASTLRDLHGTPLEGPGMFIRILFLWRSDFSWGRLLYIGPTRQQQP